MPTPSSRNGRIWVVLVALVGAGCGAEQIDGTGAAGGGGVTHSGGNGGTAGVGGVAPDAGGGGGCVRQIGASWEFTCAVRTDDSAWCWGDAGYAFLDDFVQSAHPVRLTSFGTEVVQIAAGWHHACALTKAGAVSCWGSNDAGQLGSDGVSTTAIGSDVVSVASRHNHTCVVRVDGSVWCWGSNYSGQIGDGTTVDQPLPKRVNSVGAGVTQVTVGDGHSCAATSDGTVWCWGFNHNGQLGDGTTEAKTTPTPVFKLATPPRELTSGFDFTCALEQNGSLWCWGAGQLEPSKVEGIGAKVAQNRVRAAPHLRGDGGRRAVVLGQKLQRPVGHRHDRRPGRAGADPRLGRGPRGRGSSSHLRNRGGRHSPVLGPELCQPARRRNDLGDADEPGAGRRPVSLITPAPVAAGSPAVRSRHVFISPLPFTSMVPGSAWASMRAAVFTVSPQGLPQLAAASRRRSSPSSGFARAGKTSSLRD